jgi:DNA-binding transcriptional LysR family regulator
MSALRLFHDAHQHVAVRADGLTSAQIFEGLHRGRLDIGVARVPGTTDSTLIVTPLSGVALDLLAVPRNHSLATRRSVRLEQLDGETLLLVDESDSPVVHRSTIAFFEARGITPRWVTHSATQTERALDQVAAGIGCAWINRWQAEAARRRRDVRVLRLAEPLRIDEFVIVHRRDASAEWVVPLVDTLLVAARDADGKLSR